MKRMKPEEVFEYLDDEWKYIAIDEPGLWFIHRERPHRKETGWYSIGFTGEYLPIAIDYDGPPEEALFERPKPKPKVMYGQNLSFGISLHTYNSNAEHIHSCDINQCHEAPPEVAAWFHKIMEDER